jgi:hypothetical protein
MLLQINSVTFIEHDKYPNGLKTTLMLMRLLFIKYTTTLNTF